MPDTVKISLPELFMGNHDNKTVRQFTNACDTYFKLTGVKDEKTQALFAKTRIFYSKHTCFNVQGYDNNTITFNMLLAHLKEYIIQSDYSCYAHKNLTTCKMGSCTGVDILINLGSNSSQIHQYSFLHQYVWKPNSSFLCIF